MKAQLGTTSFSNRNENVSIPKSLVRITNKSRHDVMLITSDSVGLLIRAPFYRPRM